MANTAKEISNADVLVSFSKYETFAVPVAEAWACGKPVIISDSAGIASYASEDYGRVVPNKDTDQLGKSMKEIYLNIRKFSSEKIRAYANENFSDNAVIKKLTGMYFRTY